MINKKLKIKQNAANTAKKQWEPLKINKNN